MTEEQRERGRPRRVAHPDGGDGADGRPPMVARQKARDTYHDLHPRITARLAAEKLERLRELLKRERQDFSHWLLDRIYEQETVRTPESQSGVKKVVSEDVAYLAWQLAQAEGDRYESLARAVPKRGGDVEKRRQLMAEAARYWEVAAFFAGVLRQYQEVRAKIESGVIKPRHRPRPRDLGPEDLDPDVEAWFG